jgi:hypothetical protein
MKNNNSFWFRSMVSILLALPIASLHPTAAAVLWVTNDGADSTSCGSQTVPCRSISQGIENAADGDTIEVGAGHYGNVSGNPNFAGPGDEHAQLGFVYQDVGCIICINKGVHIFSLHGAAVTVIESVPSTLFTSTVMIQSDGVIFGQPGGGFTLTGGNANGLVLDLNAAQDPYGLILKRNVTVSGNVDVGDGNGFVFSGKIYATDSPCPNPICMSAANIVFSDNQSVNNGVGFNVTVATYRGGTITLQNNLASGAGAGFIVTPSAQNALSQELDAGSALVLGNVAVNNSVGFKITLAGRTEANTAAGNSQAGFLVVPAGTFRGNSALGNAGPGMIVNFSANFFSPDLFPPTNNYSSFTQNNFYGNDRNRPVLNIGPIFNGSLPGLNPGPSADCGVLNMGDVVAALEPQWVQRGIPTLTLQAAGNFWGSTRGPAATGVGDAVGGACDQNGGVTIAKPFATTPSAITSLP